MEIRLDNCRKVCTPAEQMRRSVQIKINDYMIEIMFSDIEMHKSASQITWENQFGGI